MDSPEAKANLGPVVTLALTANQDRKVQMVNQVLLGVKVNLAPKDNPESLDQREVQVQLATKVPTASLDPLVQQDQRVQLAIQGPQASLVDLEASESLVPMLSIVLAQSELWRPA